MACKLILQVGAVLSLTVFFHLVGPKSVLGQDQTFDDESLNHIAGTPVTISVLDNDDSRENLNDASVRIVNPADLTIYLLEYVEPDQGIWTVNGDGSISLAPCTDLGIPDDRCSGAINGDPFPIDYIVRDNAGVLQNPSQVVVTYSNAPLAVTVAYFRSIRRSDESVEFTWATATEINNAGFNLLVDDSEGLIHINEELIESFVIDSITPQLYSYAADVGGTMFYLQEVSLSGSSFTFGPYELGLEYGALSPELIAGGNDTIEYLFLPWIFDGP